VSRFRLPIPRIAVGTAASAWLAIALLVAAPAAAEAAPRPARVVAGYSGEQLANARVIIAVAASRHLPVAAAVLGVATAMGESSLRNLPYGDGAINPDGSVADSLGLFQQQHWWGSKARRMTPEYAAGAFFAHLVRVPGWEGRSPTAAIHAVQRNADPNYYTRFVPAAVAVVEWMVKHPGAAADIKGGTPKSAPGSGATTGLIGATGPTASGMRSTVISGLPAVPSDLGIDPVDPIDPVDLGDWATAWDLGSVDDAISGAFAEGLGSAGGTLPADSLPQQDGN
jgi:hypothetical protein